MNILVPMDFTEVSSKGLKYAYKRFPSANITVLHAITGLLDPRGRLHTRPDATKEDLANAKLKEIICDELEINELPQNITTEAYYGEPVRVISNYLNDHAFDAVVMGSRDKYDLVDKIFGTISLGVVKRNAEPIFVIPRYASYGSYNKIMIACDESIEDSDILMQIDYWNPTNAQIKFLHVSEDSGDDFEKTKDVLLKNLYEKYQPPFSYEIETIQSKNVTESILAYAYNYGADLLIVISRPTSFIKSLVFKSTTKELILKSSIPMLFLHNTKSNEL